MNKFITIDASSLYYLKMESSTYVNKGCKLHSSYIKEVVATGPSVLVLGEKSAFVYCQNIEVPLDNVIAEIPATPAKEPFIKRRSELDAQWALLNLVDSCSGAFSASQMGELLAASCGWGLSDDLRRFVHYTLCNWANAGRILKEYRRGHDINHYRRKSA